MPMLRRVGATLGYHKKMGKAYPNCLALIAFVPSWQVQAEPVSIGMAAQAIQTERAHAFSLFPSFAFWTGCCGALLLDGDSDLGRAQTASLLTSSNDAKFVGQYVYVRLLGVLGRKPTCDKAGSSDVTLLLNMALLVTVRRAGLALAP